MFAVGAAYLVKSWLSFAIVPFVLGLRLAARVPEWCVSLMNTARLKDGARYFWTQLKCLPFNI